MTAQKGDWRIEVGFVGLVLMIAVGTAVLAVYLLCS